MFLQFLYFLILFFLILFQGAALICIFTPFYPASHLYPPSSVSLFTDNEGGNLRLVSPGGITWEIDAYNDNLRFFRYVKGSTVNNACHVAITQDGVLDVPGGIAGIGYIGSTFGQLGCGAITYYGHVTAYGLSGTVILKIGGRVRSEERRVGKEC